MILPAVTNYDYQNGSQRIRNILTQELSESERKKIPPEGMMTYSNGYTMWVGAIFVDIRNSTQLFADKNRDMVTRIARSFASEVIRILDSDPAAEIGIRGDCVYAIYSVPKKVDTLHLFYRAMYVNTLIKLLNKHYSRKNYPQINVGIGLAINEDLVIKAGSRGSGVNDRVWIGKAVPTASNLSKYGSKNGISPIVMSPIVFNNILDLLLNNGYQRSWFKKIRNVDEEFYHCNIVARHFNNWIDNNSGL